MQYRTKFTDYILGSLLALLLGNVSLPAQTPAPILQCVEEQSTGSGVVLTWNLPPDSCAPYYVFESSSPNGPFQPVDTITNPLQTMDTLSSVGSDCPGSPRYYYMQGDKSCNGTPLAHSDTISSCQPQPPRLKRVTVVGNTDVEINWYPSPSPETYAYEIYWDQLDDGNYIRIDTVFGRFNTTYIHNGAGSVPPPTPDQRSEAYRLASLDSCGNRSPLSPKDSFHQSIYLEVQVNPCDPSVTLTWNDYINWKAGVDSYRVYRSRNGSPYQYVKSLPPDSNQWTTTGFNEGDQLCFYVEAVNGKTDTLRSRSNEACQIMDIMKAPDYIYVEKVSVFSEEKILVQWRVDSTADMKRFEIQRSTNGDNYHTEYTKTAPADLSAPITYEDNELNTRQQSYYYRIVGVDSCDKSHRSVNYGKSIYLQGELIRNFENTLTWTPYEDWNHPVDRYIIHRKTDFGWGRATTVGGQRTTYNDSIRELEDADGIFCYKVEAVEEFDTISGGVNRSLSNRACVTQYPTVEVPNAFMPSGHNKVFKPVLLYAEKSDYRLVVFDRWGGMVFRTNNPDQGWNGKLMNAGKRLPQDSYVYHLRFTNPDGNTYAESGTVVLIR